MSLVFHGHPLASYCWKVLIALYENGTAFEFRLVDLGDSDSAAAFAAIWPLMKMPVLEDEKRPIFESSIIIEYLDRHHPGSVRFIPDDPDAALEARMLDRIFDHYVMTPMQKIVLDRIRSADARDPQGVAEARAMLDTACRWLDQRLAGRSWAAGDDFGLADCAAAPSLYYADRVQPIGDRFPVVAAYLARLKARSAFTRVLAEAEPYQHLFPG